MSDPQSLQRFPASLGGKPMSSKVPWRKEMPPLLHFLEQKLNNRVRSHDQVLGYDLYFVDLSAWKLRFSNATPVLWLKEGDRTGFDNARQVAESLIASGFALRSQIVWDKQQFVIGRGDYHWQHEPAWYAVRKGATGHWNGDRKQTTV